MDEYVFTYLTDVLNACIEVEQFFEGQPRLFEVFRKDQLRIRAVERNVENNHIPRLKQDVQHLLVLTD